MGTNTARRPLPSVVTLAQPEVMRAKVLPARSGGAAYDSALKVAGSSLAEECRRWGCDDAVGARVVAGTVPLTHERLRASSPRVRRAYLENELALLDAEEAAAPPPSSGDLSQATLHALAAGADVAGVVRDILADGRVEPHEVPMGLRALAKARDAYRAVDRVFVSFQNVADIEAAALSGERVR